jgi:plastocyanin
MFTSLRAVAVLALCLGFAACSDDKSTGSGGATGGKKPGNVATKTVEIRGSLYVPETVTIKVGESVKWVNRDNMKHTATRDAGDPKFDTGTLTKDQESGPVTFNVPSDGTGWQYRCTTKGHEDMKGFVVVAK